MEKILLMLAANRWSEAADALASAARMARHRERLSCGLCLRYDPDPAERESMAQWGAVCSVTEPERPLSMIEAFPLLWHGEHYALIVTPDVLFTRDWDQRLLRALRQCRRQGAECPALTGYLPEDTVPGFRAVSPVAVEERNGDMISFCPGMPLLHAPEPLRCAFLHPDFVFAKAGFFHTASDPSAALQQRITSLEVQLYTLNRPLITSALRHPVPGLDMGGMTEDEREALLRFAGLEDGERMGLSVRTGIYAGDGTYAPFVPLTVQLKEKWKEKRRTTSLMPLAVTTFMKQHEEDRYRLCYMTTLHNLPLNIYADRSCAPDVQRLHPNTVVWKEQYGLDIIATGEAERQHVERLSELLLLNVSRDKRLSFSHYIWLDRDLIDCPMYPETVFAWERICSDCIMLGTIKGEPDLSVVAVPEHLTQALKSEILRRAHAAVDSGAGLPSPEKILQDMIREMPECFRVQPVMHRGDLFRVLLGD